MKDVDDLVAIIFAALSTTGVTPTGLTVMDNDMLPLEESDLPVAGVYLVEDRAIGDESGTGSTRREATIRIEIRAIGAKLAGTKSIREWAIATTLSAVSAIDSDLDLSYASFTPYGVASNVRLAGADLDFSFKYFWKP